MMGHRIDPLTDLAHTHTHTHTHTELHLAPSFFRCTRSSTIFGGPIHQGGNTKYEGVSKMSEISMQEAVKNCIMLRPKVRMTFGLASNILLYLF